MTVTTQKLECDYLVVGSGAGALASAVTAAISGLRVIVVEKEPLFGGASARSGGWVWIPGNPSMQPGDIKRARTYLQGRAGPHWRPERVDAFLASAHEMIAFFERETPMRFNSIGGFYDYSSEDDGAAAGRGMMIEPFDAAGLGELLDHIRPPLKVMTFLNMIVELPEQAIFMKAGRSPKAALYVVRRILAHWLKVATKGRATRVANGKALIARLLEAAQRHGVQLHRNSPAISLIGSRGTGITGAHVDLDGVRTEISATRGVLLATGGFNHDAVRRDAVVPWAAGVPESWDAFPRANTGDGIRLAEEVGAHFSNDVSSPVALGPMTPFRKDVGNSPTFPQLSGRGKPGIIAVLPNGRRFCDEARSYHDFAKALIEAWNGAPGAHAWLICDRRSYRRYGLGFAKPWPLPSGQYERMGYLQRASSLAELAQQCGIDVGQLQETVERYNLGARLGSDDAFHRGETRYERVMGDADLKPNPCVAPLEAGPFYAVRVIPGALGTFAGLMTDGRARVLDDAGRVIKGLYSAGNDALSIFGGDYIGGGCTLGPAMTFGHLAALDAAGNERPRAVSDNPLEK